MYKTIKDVNLKNKKVILRVAFDVPLKKNGNEWIVADDSRIKISIPTINYLLKQNCKIILLSYLGRPNGKVMEDLRLKPVAKKLKEILKTEKIIYLKDCIGKEVEKKTKKMESNEIILLENTRFHPEEEKNDLKFAKKLAHLGNIFINDAFAQSHRNYASTVGITKFLPSAMGLNFEKEIKILTKIKTSSKKPLVIVIGGVKIDSKIDVIKNFLKQADQILIGGVIGLVFLKELGYKVGKLPTSFLKGQKKDLIKKMLAELLPFVGEKIILPVDGVIKKINGIKKQLKEIDIAFLNSNGLSQISILDIGHQTIELFSQYIRKAKTVIWNGPMGLFENKKFNQGTKKIAQAIANSKNYSVIGGGDTEEAISNFKLNKKISHVCVAGGAMLEFLANKKLPALEVLKK
ncbi:phosphoglycerate kinase [Candidatus Kuenenbacteria bacterium HGW-Kuenenbacteria-1]|uniref:Phosphoglycerate kinase n=1 Tax=Candidatus Kuenenbacteria bacterium HGW-Kuenenbacteria-1 TaxID=2013812 RepID=A0A2N1UNI8_9BACT|nr:MAG: phosphoglycerate kinase [Candidatus Kuenenbacteria bacterium HGW-Kuenenbacteria-1]